MSNRRHPRPNTPGLHNKRQQPSKRGRLERFIVGTYLPTAIPVVNQCTFGSADKPLLVRLC